MTMPHALSPWSMYDQHFPCMLDRWTMDGFCIFYEHNRYNSSFLQINIEKTMNKKELEKRLVDFAAAILNEIQKLENDKSTNHLTGQVIRSASSAALNYGEAQSAESKKDFIHKISIVMKELRETMINLSIIINLDSYKDNDVVKKLIKENDELIAIFHRTIQTARKNSSLDD